MAEGARTALRCRCRMARARCALTPARRTALVLLGEDSSTRTACGRTVGKMAARSLRRARAQLALTRAHARAGRATAGMLSMAAACTTPKASVSNGTRRRALTPATAPRVTCAGARLQYERFCVRRVRRWLPGPCVGHVHSLLRREHMHERDVRERVCFRWRQPHGLRFGVGVERHGARRPDPATSTALTCSANFFRSRTVLRPTGAKMAAVLASGDVHSLL